VLTGSKKERERERQGQPKTSLNIFQSILIENMNLKNKSAEHNDLDWGCPAVCVPEDEFSFAFSFSLSLSLSFFMMEVNECPG
jgi:hypothetical protein